MIHNLLIFIISLFSLLSYGESLSASEINFDTLEKGKYSRYAQSGGAELSDVTVIRFDNEADFRKFWLRHKDSQMPKPELPRTDFRTDTVIAVSDKVEPSGGYSVSVNRLQASEKGRIVISVTKISPGPDCLVKSTITQPFHIIRIPKIPERSVLSLALTKETVKCTP